MSTWKREYVTKPRRVEAGRKAKATSAPKSKKGKKSDSEPDAEN